MKDLIQGTTASEASSERSPRLSGAGAGAHPEIADLVQRLQAPGADPARLTTDLADALWNLSERAARAEAELAGMRLSSAAQVQA